MKMIFLFILFISLSAMAQKKVEEGAFILDPQKKLLKSISVNSELVIDHINSQGYEVHGPKGTLKFLEAHSIPHYSYRALMREADNNYPTPEEIENQIYDLNRKFPNLTRVINIGRSVQGRNLLVLKISDNPDANETEPEFKYISSMHGDEITGRELMVQLASDILNSYENDENIRDLVDSTEIFIMASMNPDGSARKMRGNANFVDLNRDFPDFSTSDNQNTSEGRQPETAAIMNFQKNRQFSLSANFHGGAEVVNYAWDTIPDQHPFYDLLIKLSLEYSKKVPYIYASTEFRDGITNGYAWYEVNGGMQDWSYYWYNDLQFTVELSEMKWPNYSQIPYYYRENKEALIEFIKYIHMGVGFKLSQSEISGTVQIYKNTSSGNQDLGSYDFRDSEFYKVLEPGEYTFDIVGNNGLKKRLSRLTVEKQEENFSPNFFYLD